MSLTTVRYEVGVDVTPEAAWTVLAQYTNVGEFNSALLSSKHIGENAPVGLGAERFCQIDKKIKVWERIVEWKEGREYSYDVYDWKNFPLKKMIATFGVKKNSAGKTVIYQVNRFRLSPGFLTYVMKGKLRSNIRDAMLSYKHYMETGEKRVALRNLRKQYSAY